MVGTDIPTITEDTAIRDIVTADGIATVGVGIATDGIATKQGGSNLARNWATINLPTTAIAPSGGGQQVRLRCFQFDSLEPELLDIENHGVL